MPVVPASVSPRLVYPATVNQIAIPAAASQFAPVPYLLDFLTVDWTTENGATWAASSLGIFDAPNHVGYNAQTPDNPTWSSSLVNAEPSIAGDARLTGYIMPASLTNQAQIQVLRLDNTNSGYAAIALWAAPAVGLVALFHSIGGVFTLIDSAVVGLVSQSQGLWLKIEDLGGGTVRARAIHKQAGIWATACDITETTAASVAAKPAWVFNSNDGTPVIDAQTYHAVKFEGNRDASISI